MNKKLDDEAGHIAQEFDFYWGVNGILNQNLKFTMKQCKKQTTYAVIYKDGQLIATGSNEIKADIDICPRDLAGMKSGEGYELCKSTCNQKGHAEVMACITAGKAALGGTLYLMGHTYCCDNCIEVMADHGIFEVVICDLKENNRFSPVGVMLAKKYEKMNLSEFIEAISPKSVEP
jgi:deoxycytidylate deaminase